MLYVLPCVDEKIGAGLARMIFGSEEISDGALLLYDDETPIGFAEVGVGDGCVTVERIGVVPEMRHRGAGDFFARVIIFKLLAYELPIKLNFVGSYYKNLGFKEENGAMVAEFGDVVFPSRCGKNHD